MREVIPWHRLEERASTSEAPPASGVRVAEEVDSEELVSEPEGALSFQVYTLAELEARLSVLDPSQRASYAEEQAARARREAWELAARRGIEVAAEALAWARGWAKERVRPPALSLRRATLLLGDALAAALRTVDWRKVGVLGGASVGAALVLLGVVLALADATDDIGSVRARAALVASAAPPAQTVVARPPAAASPVAAPAPAAEPEPDFEIEASPPVAAPTAVAPRSLANESAAPRSRVRRAAPGATPPSPRAKSGKLAFRDADEVFNP